MIEMVITDRIMQQSMQQSS